MSFGNQRPAARSQTARSLVLCADSHISDDEKPTQNTAACSATGISTVCKTMPNRRETRFQLHCNVVSHTTEAKTSDLIDLQHDLQVDQRRLSTSSNQVHASNLQDACIDAKSPKITTSKTETIIAPAVKSNISRGAKSNRYESEMVKLRNEFKHILKGIRRTAPEQLELRAYPTNRPCDLVPTTVNQYISFREQTALWKMEQSALRMAQLRLKARVSHLEKGIKSALGKNGKVYETGGSPVLYRITIFSLEYDNLALPKASWPAAEEFFHEGDNRMDRHRGDKRAARIWRNNRRYGRQFPLPRMPGSADYKRRPYMKPFPMDLTGSIHSDGPSYQEIDRANQSMNSDPSFERTGTAWLGHDLMMAVGPWSKPVIPDWLKARRSAADGDVLGEFRNQFRPIGSCLS